VTPLSQASILICTHNRASDLALCCAALGALDDPPGSWEAVVVDNASTDATPAVAREWATRLGGRLRVVREEALGLSAARNRAVAEARGEILVFLDDDALPEPAWLQALVEVLSRPGVMAAGGPVEPRFEGELPAWLGERYLPYLTVWDLGSEVVPLVYNEYPRGANMAFRREVFERLGGFSHHLGRKGTKLLSCEETELCLRIERSGGRILYAPGARVRHKVAAARIDKRWMAARFFSQGRSEAILEWRHGGMAGLRVGLRRTWGYTRAAARATGEAAVLHLRFQRQALWGYALGALEAVAAVPRYRAGAGAGVELAPWLPFG
jgi:GT2 family glycosyltransferase